MTALLALAIQVAAQPSSSRPKMIPDGLNAIADACHAPRKWLELRGQQVVFGADPDADYAKIECLLTKILAVTDQQNLAFIGNALPPEEK